MFRITMAHAIRHHISSKQLFGRLGLQALDTYYHHRILRWAGHVARMPMSRVPRKLLTSWVEHRRPTGSPQMTWGRTLKKALKRSDIPTDFATWSTLAQDRQKWRAAVHAKDTHPPLPTPAPPAGAAQPPPAPPALPAAAAAVQPPAAAAPVTANDARAARAAARAAAKAARQDNANNMD